MPRSWYNHVSIWAKDMEESQAFYEELFGAEVVPTPNMGAPVRWLKIGNLQLHFYGNIKPGGLEPMVETTPKYGHFALGVDDFAEFYALAQARGADEDDSIWGHPLNVLPNGQVQYYVRDPTGNLVEVNFTDASLLPEDILERAEYQKLRFDQTDDQLKARLFLEESDSVSAGSD